MCLNLPNVTERTLTHLNPMFVEAHIARCQDRHSNGLPCSCGIEYFARPGGVVGIDENEYRVVLSLTQEQNGDVSWFACHKSGKNETIRDGIVSATTDPATTMRAAWSAAIKFLSVGPRPPTVIKESH